MKLGNKSSWMVKPKSFIRLLGADYNLMRQSGNAVLFKFYTSSFIICLIALLSFFSVRYAIELMFHDSFVEILLSTFLSALFLLMYIFLINTFTKNVQHKTILSISNITRTGFVIFMGFILSKPLEVYLFKNQLEKDVIAHKEKLAKEHEVQIKSIYAGTLLNLNNQKRDLQSLNDRQSFNQEIEAVDLRINSLQDEETNLIDASKSRIDQGTFFVFQIKKVSSSYPLSWLFCLGFVLIFLLPGFIIYSISKENTYFKLKHDFDKKLITIGWLDFTRKYTQLFKNKYELAIEFYTKFEDPPFNTKLNETPPHKNATDFHIKYGVS
jgi:hypothetical protein